MSNKTQLETQLKKQLKTIAAAGFKVPADFDLYSLALGMMDHIGSLDSDLRDGLIYSSLGTWIVKLNYFSQQQLAKLLDIALDDQHLFYQIDEDDLDTVYTRSFSMLIVPLILMRHQKEPFLSKATLQQVKARLLDFVVREKDLRGFVPGRGWAHAAAHGADAIDDLALCPEMNKADLHALLAGLNSWITTQTIPLVHEEDERFTTAVISIINRNLIPQEELEAWIKAFKTQLDEAEHRPDNRIYINVKNFLRSFYFRLFRKNPADPLCRVINEALEVINNFKVSPETSSS